MPAATPQIPIRSSLVAQTVRSLQEAIRGNVWGHLLPGERELSERLQISRKTLRAALAELERMGWLRGAARQRRKIHHARRGVRAVAERKIAILLHSSALSLAPPMTFVIEALRRTLPAAGCAVEWHVQRACFSAQPGRALEKLVREHRAAAWLIVGSKEPMQRWFIRHRLACLVLGTPSPEVALPSVDLDYRAACRHAGGVLLRHGHRRLALVLPQDAYGGDLASEGGLREALAGVGEARLRVLRHDGSVAHLGGLLDHALRGAEAPTGFVVAHATQVLTVLTHLMRRGRRIPQDAAIISRDDDPSLQFLSPSIARYTINPAQLARRVSLAARQLAEAGAIQAAAIRLIPRYTAGESV